MKIVIDCDRQSVWDEIVLHSRVDLHNVPSLPSHIQIEDYCILGYSFRSLNDGKCVGSEMEREDNRTQWVEENVLK